MQRNFFKKPAIVSILIVLAVAITVTIVLAVTTSPVTVTDTFHDTSKINTAANINITVDTVNGQVTLSAASSWTCGSLLFDSRDGQSYATVFIGGQCWMSQNLNVGTKITSCVNGYVGTCTTGSSTVQNQGTSTVSIQKYCYGDNNAYCPFSTGSTTNEYGGLYQWTQAMGGSTSTTGIAVTGICPANWHLPTDAEYKTLETSLGMCTGTASSPPPYCTDDSGQYRGTTQGDQLKGAGLCGGRTPCGTSGFNGLLAGDRSTDGSFTNQGSAADLWSSLVSGGSAWARTLYSGIAGVNRTTNAQAYGFSVRCVHN